MSSVIVQNNWDGFPKYETHLAPTSRRCWAGLARFHSALHDSQHISLRLDFMLDKCHFTYLCNSRTCVGFSKIGRFFECFYSVKCIARTNLNMNDSRSHRVNVTILQEQSTVVLYSIVEFLMWVETHGMAGPILISAESHSLECNIAQDTVRQ